MKPLGLDLNLSTEKTRKRDFLEETERVVPWAVLFQIVEPYYPNAVTERRLTTTSPGGGHDPTAPGKPEMTEWH